MKLKAIIHRMLAMCPTAWYIFIRSIQLCALLLLCAFVLLLECGAARQATAYAAAMSLFETGQVLLLAAALVPVCIEDFQK